MALFYQKNNKNKENIMNARHSHYSRLKTSKGIVVKGMLFLNESVTERFTFPQKAFKKARSLCKKSSLLLNYRSSLN